MTRISIARTLSAVGMTVSAALTAQEALGATGLGESFHAAFSEQTSALEALVGDGSGIELNIANGLWLREGWSLLPDYLLRLDTAYDAAVASVDFAHDPDSARQAINAWIAARTQDRISELLQPGTIDSLTFSVLVNTVYCSGAWHYPFDPGATVLGSFRAGSGVQEDAYMMRQLTPLPYFEDHEVQVAELPFRDNGQQNAADLSLLLVVPRAEQTLEAVEQGLDPEQLASWVEGLEVVNSVDLTLPRFKVEARADLVPVLKHLGVSEAFRPFEADFSRMTDAQGVHLSKAIHQAFLQVDEAGAEAAAATAIEMNFTSVRIAKAELLVDRPFLVFLRQPSTGALLFAARVVNPEPVDRPLLETMRAYFGPNAVLAKNDSQLHCEAGAFWTADFPWIYHEGLHWVYADGSGGDRMWWWQLDAGWLWTSLDHFPYFWREADQSWYFWADGTTTPPWFYVYGNNAWQSGW